MKLRDILDIDLLNQHLINRLVGVQRHPHLPLCIYNYTQSAQFENKWGDGTIDLCRGLIVDNNGEVVARPFKKFHNINTSFIPETMQENLPAWPPMFTTEKLDGSLGVLWAYGGELGIATRGSFTSPQSKWATDRYFSHLNRIGKDIWPIGYTPLFEIIYAENRIVVDYKFEGLVLIGLINNATGRELPYSMLRSCAADNGLQVVRKVDGDLISLMNANIPNEEGYVVTFENGLKVKIKMAEYCALHKIVTGMNPRSVWELLSSGADMSQFDHMPVHFQKWLESWRSKLSVAYNDIECEVKRKYCGRPLAILDDYEPRKYRAEFAEWVRSARPEIHGLLFAMLDGKNPTPIIWRMIKPRGDDKTFRTDGE